MSAPPSKYVRVFDFNNFSTNYPTVPQPGLQIDAELNALQVVTSATIDRLALIQRSDGALFNGVVTLDAMSPQILSLVGGWNPRGQWVTLASYAYKDVTVQNSASYVCLIAHVAGVFATDLAAGKWALIAQVGISVDGTSTITANIPFNTHKITGLAPGTVGTDAVNKTQMDTADSAEVTARNLAIVAATPAASETVSGLAEIATQGETDTGTDDARMVTPKKLANSVLAGTVAANTAAIAAITIRKPVPVRQTVLAGPVDANGLPNFGGATGAATVTASGTIVATAANSEDANGQVDRVGSKVNPSWTGLSTNGTMYLYVDVAANGTLTEGAGTVAPVYQFGGAYSVTANAFTFNTQEMVGKVGSGAAAAQTYRVYVGEVTVAGNVVSAIVWYALKGRYKSAFTQNLPATTTVVSFNHNIGTNLVEVPKLTIECTTIDNGYAVGDQIVNPTTWLNTDGAMVFNHTLTSRNAAQFATDGTNAFRTMPKTGGATVGLTQNSWKYALAVKRDW